MINSKVSKAKLARITAGLRQMDLANMAGVSPASISFWENGLQRPDFNKAKVLNDILGQKVYQEK